MVLISLPPALRGNANGDQFRELEKKTTMTTVKNNFCHSSTTIPSLENAVRLRDEKETVVFTSWFIEYFIPFRRVMMPYLVGSLA